MTALASLWMAAWSVSGPQKLSLPALVATMCALPPVHAHLFQQLVFICPSTTSMQWSCLLHVSVNLQVFTITAPEEQEVAVREFVQGMSPRAHCTYAIAGTLKFELPSDDITLSAVFDAMASASKRGLTVLDWGVHSASLEDVFIRLAKANQAAQQAQDSKLSANGAALQIVAEAV